MKEPIVVDVGNTRIKWGRCQAGQVREIAALPPNEPDAWQAQLQAWELQPQQTWIVSGVHPQRRDALIAWLQQHSERVTGISSHAQLPLHVALENPEKVGIDRLLNAVAANSRRARESAAVLVDAGTAVTVDYVDAAGAFRGGAIFPGFRLMTHALHDYTALLPIVPIDETVEFPGTSTIRAIQAGVYAAVLGGIKRLIAEYQDRFAVPQEIYLTGGDASLLAAQVPRPHLLWPEMTLEGILHSHAR